MEFIELGTPMFRVDHRGRIKVKIIEVLSKERKVIIHRSILLPSCYEKTDFVTRLKHSCWDEVIINLEDDEKVRRMSMFILLSELRKGYLEREFLLGHQEPCEFEPFIG